jgi:zinc-ribbon domain
MFCPKCAAQNLDGASYCRVCGANISLVPQAITGQLPRAVEEDESGFCGTGRKRRQKEPSLESAFKNAFIGIAFLLVALALLFSRVGTGWWFWMLIPAFSLMGTGVAQYIRYKEEQRRWMMPGGRVQPPIQSAPSVRTLSSPNTGELAPTPPSVTEGTTRHLGAELPTRHLDASADSRK